jgi:hypothetical protein
MNEYEMSEETMTLTLMGYNLVRKGVLNKWKSMSPKQSWCGKGFIIATTIRTFWVVLVLEEIDDCFLDLCGRNEFALEGG